MKINALAIPPQAGDEIVKRFAARLDDLVQVEGFELLKPTGETETRWFVYTRWADEAAYQGWRSGESFAKGHAGQGDDGAGDSESERPWSLSTGATLLEFEVTIAVP